MRSGNEDKPSCSLVALYLLTLLDRMRFFRLKRWALRTVPYNALPPPPPFLDAALPFLLSFPLLLVVFDSVEELDEAELLDFVVAVVEADCVESTLSSDDPASSPPTSKVSSSSDPSSSNSGFFLRLNMGVYLYWLTKLCSASLIVSSSRPANPLLPLLITSKVLSPK